MQLQILSPRTRIIRLHHIQRLAKQSWMSYAETGFVFIGCSLSGREKRDGGGVYSAGRR
jgi:hypothetical protein